MNKQMKRAIITFVGISGCVFLALAIMIFDQATQTKQYVFGGLVLVSSLAMLRDYSKSVGEFSGR